MHVLKNYLKQFVKSFRNNNIKTLMVIVYLYPILPLGLLATSTLFWGFGSHLSNGLQHSSLSQVIYQFLLFSGGVSGLIGGLMVLLNRITPTSLLLFLHGSISYAFVVVIFNSLSVRGGGAFLLLHGFYILMTIVVVAIQLYVIVKKVISDHHATKEIDANVLKET